MSQTKLTLIGALVFATACDGSDGKGGSATVEDAGSEQDGASADGDPSTADGSASAEDAGGSPVSDAGGSGPTPAPTVPVFEEVVFYDGYAMLVDAPAPEGVTRLRNDVITRKLDASLIAQLEGGVAADVTIGALCDNYDRIGNVGLALVPKGAASYVYEEVTHLELGRFITPFMNKNRQPDEVHYHFDLTDAASILKDPALLAEFDPWLELEVFGVPYAANQEVQGCADRNDVFRGSLTLEVFPEQTAESFDTLIPLAYKAPFNNYQEGASDQVGTTKKTLPFTLDVAASDAQLVLITSNHGANAGGEEYVRREHHVSVDGRDVLTYVPGRTSCEPFRAVNTQPNGIYGASPRSDAEWQSFSNWCPGDVIDTRVIPLGALAAGEHSFVIDVPAARFSGADGNFPLSLYVQARR